MKSERVVSNPENHGWEEVNGKWIWASGRNTGHIVDGDTEGQITTWHDASNAWTPEGAVVVSNGNVGIGAAISSVDTSLHINRADAGIKVESNNNNIPHLDLIRTASSNNYRIVNDNSAFEIRHGATGALANTIAKYQPGGSERWEFNTGNTPRLTIDSSGNATFSGNLEVSGTGRHYAKIKTTSQAGAQLIMENSDHSYSIFTGRANGIGTFDKFVINDDTAGTSRLAIDATGNATFSGDLFGFNYYINANAGTVGVRSGSRFEFYEPVAGNNRRLVFHAAGLNDPFYIDGIGDATFRGKVTVEGNRPVISTRDLIETLATLRASTLDETVDVRQALASACDKLIEKFESMQEVATQEIEVDG